MNSIHLIGNCKKGGATNVSTMWYDVFKNRYPNDKHLYCFCFPSIDDYPWLKKCYLFAFSTLVKIVKISRSNKTLFICHTIKPQVIGLALFFLLYPRSNLVLVVHNQDAYIANPFIKAAWFFLQIFASKIVFVSRDSLLYYSSKLSFLDKNKLFVVRNGILDNLFTHSRQNKSCTYLSSDGRPRFGIASRLIKQKNIPLVIDIINSLEREKLRSIFHIYGDGDDSYLLPNPLDYKYVEIKNHGFCTDINQIYSSIDIFISTSLWEGFPISPLEALSFGCLCVLSPLPQHRELSAINSRIEIASNFCLDSFMVSIFNILDILKSPTLSRSSMLKYNRLGLNEINSNFNQSLTQFLTQIND